MQIFCRPRDEKKLSVNHKTKLSHWIQQDKEKKGVDQVKL